MRKYMISPVASTNVVMNGLEKTAGSARTALASNGIAPPTVAAMVHTLSRVSPMTITAATAITMRSYAENSH